MEYIGDIERQHSTFTYATNGRGNEMEHAHRGDVECQVPPNVPSTQRMTIATWARLVLLKKVTRYMFSIWCFPSRIRDSARSCAFAVVLFLTPTSLLFLLYQSVDAFSGRSLPPPPPCWWWSLGDGRVSRVCSKSQLMADPQRSWYSKSQDWCTKFVTSTHDPFGWIQLQYTKGHFRLSEMKATLIPREKASFNSAGSDRWIPCGSMHF